MTPAEFEDAKAIWKFFYAHECFKQVENACSFIIDNSLDENHLDSRWSLRHSA